MGIASLYLDLATGFISPRLVKRWPAHRHLLVPFLGSAEARIDIEYHPPVVEQEVTDELTYGEICLDGIHASTVPKHQSVNRQAIS